MKSKSYLRQFMLLFVWILCVILIFKLISEKQVAALFAGAGFIMLPATFLILELKQIKVNRIHASVLSLFLLIAALPIFLIRILNWGVDFNTLNFAGVPAATLHGISNIFYLMMMASCLFQFLSLKKSQK